MKDVTLEEEFKPKKPKKPKKKRRPPLTVDEVVAIRERAKKGEYLKDLAVEFNMHTSAISMVASGRSYKDYPGPISKRGYRKQAVHAKNNGVQQSPKLFKPKHTLGQQVTDMMDRIKEARDLVDKALALMDEALH